MLNLNIQQRVIFLSLLPLIIIALVLGIFFVKTQMVHIDNSLNRRGHSLARYMASASAHSVSTNNFDVLKPIVQSILKESDIKSVIITNEEGSILLRLSSADNELDLRTNENGMHKDNLIFMKPILETDSNSVNTTNNSPTPTSNANTKPVNKNVLGWAIIEISKDSSRAQQYLSLKEFLLLAVILLLLSFALIYRLSRRIASPIAQITQAANAIEKGQLDIELETGASGELLTLERSVKHMADSLKKSKQELQNEVDKATTELLTSIQVVEKKNKELATARQQALLASRVKSEFLANMSHEIRTPMNGILGFIKLLRKTNPSEQQLEHIETIEKSSNNLLGIINDVLDISKIESGKIRLQNATYNLRDCVEEVLSLLAPSAYEKQLNLVSIIYSDVPLSLNGDSSKTRQILTNLISNAIKFTDQGNIVVRTMLENEYEGKTKIKISISDTGIGIVAKDQHRLFKTFEQVDSSSTRKYGGTGLGLAISKSLAELMQGEIGLHSELGQGSTFWFTFVHEKLASKSNREMEQKIPSLSGYNVLLYETNQATQLALTHLFEHWKIVLDTTSRLEDVYEKIKIAEQNAPYDLIVLGLGYSELDQDTHAAIITQIHKQTQTNLLCLLNSADSNLASSIINLGANAVLSKPTRFNELHNVLQSLLNPNNEIFTYNAPPLENTKSTPGTASSNTDVIQVSSNALEGLNVLVAEDNDINAKLVENILRDQGAQITLVNNGEKAVQACASQSFDVILMDIHMPETNGVEATKQIRQHQTKKRQTPIIALTADAMPEDQLIFIDAGMNDVMIKPINEEHLINKILYLTDTLNTSSQATELLTLPKNTGNKNKGTTSNKTQRMAAEMQAELIKELPSVMSSIQNAFQDLDYDALFQHIHKLHGAVSYCDLPDIKSLLQQIERYLKTKQYDSIDSTLDILLQKLDLLTQSV